MISHFLLSSYLPHKPLCSEVHCPNAKFVNSQHAHCRISFFLNLIVGLCFCSDDGLYPKRAVSNGGSTPEHFSANAPNAPNIVRRTRRRNVRRTSTSEHRVRCVRCVHYCSPNTKSCSLCTTSC